MNVISATDARKNLYGLMDETALAHKPVLITGKRTNSVLVSQEDWDAIQETLYLLYVHGMRESVKEAKDTPPDEWITELDW